MCWLSHPKPLFLLFFTILKLIERQKNRKLIPIYCCTPQMSTMAEASPGRCWEMGHNPSQPHEYEGPNHLNHYCCLQGLEFIETEIGNRARTQIQALHGGLQVFQRQLSHWTKQLCLFIHNRHSFSFSLTN